MLSNYIYIIKKFQNFAKNEWGKSSKNIRFKNGRHKCHHDLNGYPFINGHVNGHPFLNGCAESTGYNLGSRQKNPPAGRNAGGNGTRNI